MLITCVALLSACAASVENGGGQGFELVTIQTKNGDVVGRVESDTLMFRGIPYAKPPTGDLRWKPPQEVSPWSKPLDATLPGPHCPQFRHPQTSSEDCLTLNVYSSKNSRLKDVPVVVWIHGGGYRIGSSAYLSSRSIGNTAEEIRGSLWTQQDVILVSMNYRLGALGFLSHESLDESDGANFGLLDIVAALRWVNDNIGFFGGDKDRVTIIGSSAGGNNVQALMVMPQSLGLFSAAISMSGYGTTALPRARSIAALPGSIRAEAVTNSILEKATRKTAEELRAVDIRSLSSDQLVNAVGENYHYPIVDGITLLEEPGVLFSQGKQHPVPYMSGGNTFDGSGYDDDVGITGDQLLERTRPHEETIRALYGIQDTNGYSNPLKQLFGDMRYVSAARYTSINMYKVDQPSYLYLFDYVPINQGSRRRGASHSWQKRPLFRDENLEVINMMRQYIVNFATHGDPNGDGLPKWPAVGSHETPWMVFGQQLRVEEDVLQEKLDVLQSAYENRIAAVGP